MKESNELNNEKGEDREGGREEERRLDMSKSCRKVAAKCSLF